VDDHLLAKSVANLWAPGDPVACVLARLRSEGEAHDRGAKRRVAEQQASAGARLGVAERAVLCRDAPIAVSEGVAALLYLLTRARAPCRVVEFGASLGVSTIYLAAALRDGGHGSLVTTEIDPPKATALTANLRDAGLDGLVEVRVGDALETLRTLPESVDLLCLDGWNELYLPVLRLVAPRLSADALIVADLSADDPDLRPYLEHVRDARSGEWSSTTLPLDAGVEISIRRAS
jgi:predicted O-methyltransferase YrrM